MGTERQAAMSGSEFSNGCGSIQLEVYRMCEDAAAVAARAYTAAYNRGGPDYEANMARAAARQRKWSRRGHRALMNDTRFINAVIRWI